MSVFLQDVKTAFFNDVTLFTLDDETPYNLGSFFDLSKVFFFKFIFNGPVLKFSFFRSKKPFSKKNVSPSFSSDFSFWNIKIFLPFKYSFLTWKLNSSNSNVETLLLNWVLEIEDSSSRFPS